VHSKNYVSRKNQNDLQFGTDGVLVKQTWTVLLNKNNNGKVGNSLIKA
jgi:hypothetical protein